MLTQSHVALDEFLFCVLSLDLFGFLLSIFLLDLVQIKMLLVLEAHHQVQSDPGWKAQHDNYALKRLDPI